LIAAAAGLAASAALAADPDFSNYVALGDSLTAGVESGCIVERHQLKSYPALLAQAMGHVVATVGDTDLAHFQQPLVSEPGLLQPCYTAVFAGGTIGINTHAGEEGGHPENSLLGRPYNNLGIPFAHSYDLVDRTTSNGTDSYALVLRNFGGSPLNNTSAVLQAIGEHATFITVWIGQNDVLDAAGTGTVLSDSCLAVSAEGGGSCDGVTFTTLAKFTAKYNQILQTLRGGLPNATIVVFTVPDVTSLPFSRTIPPVVVNPATRQPVLDPAGHVIPLIGQKHDGTVGQIPLNTLVTLPASGYEALGIGIPCAIFPAGHAPALCDHPLPDGGITLAGLSSGVLLYSDEVAVLRQRTADYNTAINAAAAAVGAKVVDSNAIYADIEANGRSYAGVHISTAFLTGGFISYDGVHPSTGGYAIAADEFIKAMNEDFGWHLPRINVFRAIFEPDGPIAADSSVRGDLDAKVRESAPSRSVGAELGAIASNLPLAPVPLSALYPIEAWQGLLDSVRPGVENLRVLSAREVFDLAQAR
jgi:lysophospholipase L1-like esterase